MEQKKENLIGQEPETTSGRQIKKQPVVVLVGHIDHGKTSILDFIRKSHTAKKETGGITQHIGAYEIERDEKKITFIDTPGHEAFSAMRGRGAKVADIAILVVAADEGVQPQTKEAILHIKKAQIPMIVAINKIDRPTAQSERVKDALSKNDVLLEQRGGKIPSVEVSAKTGKSIPDLLDLILLVAEMENITADVLDQAKGVVIESCLDSKKGPVATILLEKGVLEEENIIGTPSCFGKIKRMENFLGEKVEKVFPGQPVQILGFEKAPIFGEKFKIFPDLETAKQSIEEKKETISIISPEPDQKILNIVLKTDFLGSIEPIEQVLKTLPQEKIILRVLRKDVGDVNLADVKLAETGKALILGFRIKAPALVSETAKKKGIRVLTFDLIYDLVEGVRSFMNRILAPELVRTDFGKLKVLVIFRTEKKRQIVGGRILEGEIKKGLKLEIFRKSEEGEDEKIGTGKIISLEKDKKEIEKGIKGDEIGILYEGEEKIQEEDILVAFEEKRQKLEI